MIDPFILALRTIAGWPVTDERKNLDAVNMRRTASNALALFGDPAQESVLAMMHATDLRPHGRFIVEFASGRQQEFQHFSEFAAWVMERLRLSPAVRAEKGET